MMHTRQPSKEAVRQWLRQQLQLRRPPPDPQQIRRELDWAVIKPGSGERL
jgi:hypothetical protein